MASAELRVRVICSLYQRVHLDEMDEMDEMNETRHARLKRIELISLIAVITDAGYCCCFQLCSGLIKNRDFFMVVSNSFVTL